jgi:predicted transcriptional regulator
MSYTDGQRLVLQTLLHGRKRWTKILKETGLSRVGLTDAIQKLTEKGVVARDQPPADEYPPPVYYQIQLKHINDIRKLLSKDPTTRVDLYNDFRVVLESVLQESDTTLRFRMLFDLLYGWASERLYHLMREVWLAAVCSSYGDDKTERQILNHAKRNFFKTADNLIEASKKDPAVLLAIGEGLGIADEEFSVRLEEETRKYSHYPGRTAMLQWMGEELESWNAPTLTELKKESEHSSGINIPHITFNWTKQDFDAAIANIRAIRHRIKE